MLLSKQILLNKEFGGVIILNTKIKKYIIYTLYLGIFLYFLYLLIFYYDLESIFHNPNEHPFSKEKWLNIKYTDVERSIIRSTMYIRPIVDFIGLCLIVLRKNVFEQIKLFFKNRINLIFTISLIFILFISKYLIYNADKYRVYMSIVPFILRSMLVFKFLIYSMKFEKTKKIS